MKKCGKKISFVCTAMSAVAILMWISVGNVNVNIAYVSEHLIADTQKFMLEFSTMTSFADNLNCTCPNRTEKMYRYWEESKRRGDDIQNSSCDIYSSLRGGGQSVVSFSFFGDVNGPFFRGIALNAQLVAEKYPSWTMRVYHNLNVQHDEYKSLLCGLWCAYHHLDLCYIEDLPTPLHNQSLINPRVWRYNVLGDTLVDRFTSRDSDSLIDDREVSAVTEWLKSGRTWHFMRDSPHHSYPILAGMWGGLNRNRSLNLEILKQVLHRSTTFTNFYSDQLVLDEYLLPLAENTSDYVNHDSYYCGKYFKNFSPWPVQRTVLNDFVGSDILRHTPATVKPCPTECRPTHHQNWTYC